MLLQKASSPSSAGLNCPLEVLLFYHCAELGRADIVTKLSWVAQTSAVTLGISSWCEEVQTRAAVALLVR